MQKIILLLGICLLFFPIYGNCSSIDLSKTGQTKCYDYAGTIIPCSGTGQDGEIQKGISWPSPRFVPSGDCITDNLTGLMWTKDANLRVNWSDWQTSLNYIISKNIGSGICGYNDWRLPNILELESLVSSDQWSTGTWLTNQGFKNVNISSAYWSSTNLTNNAWTFGFNYHSISAVGKKNWDCYFWPVRTAHTPKLWKTGQTLCYDPEGNQIGCSNTLQDGDIKAGVAWPTNRFIVSNSCVADNLTGLTWSKNANLPNAPLTWQEALNFVASINSGTGICGHNDWRLPNRIELQSLIDYGRYNLLFF